MLAPSGVPNLPARNVSTRPLIVTDHCHRLPSGGAGESRQRSLDPANVLVDDRRLGDYRLGTRRVRCAKPAPIVGDLPNRPEASGRLSIGRQTWPSALDARPPPRRCSRKTWRPTGRRTTAQPGTARFPRQYPALRAPSTSKAISRLQRRQRRARAGGRRVSGRQRHYPCAATGSRGPS